ncbi:MAG: DNA recombination protein RmuC, partial [Deltaproteobacteria bacterium]|nr:DNA recombination protein RmuC [Deltaproteobacteria bacterium]
MVIALYIIAGLVIGALFTWLWTRTASNRAHEAEAREKSASAVVEELRRQLQGKDAEIGRLRGELDNERSLRVEAATRLEASQKSLEGERVNLDAMKREMTDSFNALSKAALESSNESFLTLASERLGKVVEETKGRLGEHKAALDGIIKPLEDTLKRYDEQIRLMEAGRHKEYGSLAEQLRTLASAQEELQKETGNLANALRRPQVRGRWGEITLRRVAELAGMTAHIDFMEQVTVSTDAGRLRPDMVINMPMGRQIVVDAKVSLDAYLNAASTTTDDERKARLKDHAAQVKAHILKLSSKEYWSQFQNSPELVVLFLPGESFFSSAIETDATLMEESMKKNVIIASPMTFMALLRTVAFEWRQEQSAKNIEEVAKLGRDLYDRMNVLTGHFRNVGSN